MGHTKVMCIVTGPSEQQVQRRGGQQAPRDTAAINVNVVVAGFSSVDRKKRGRNDKYVFLLDSGKDLGLINGLGVYKRLKRRSRMRFLRIYIHTCFLTLPSQSLFTFYRKTDPSSPLF
jgi:hypothetical protein